MRVGMVLGTTLLLPKKVGPFTDAMLKPFQLLTPRLQDVAIRREWPAAADMQPRMQRWCLRLGHELHGSGELQRLLLGINGFRSTVLVFQGDWKHVEDCAPCVLHVNQTFFYAAFLSCPNPEMHYTRKRKPS